MTALQKIREALEGNPNIIIVGSPFENNFLPGRSGYWSHTVCYYVAPIDGLYTEDELQSFMISLIPDLEPTMKDDFREFDSTLGFGKLYFDEVIGTETIHREIVLTDETMFETKGFTNGERKIDETKEIKRRTWIRLYPNLKIAEAALKGENEYDIDKKKLLLHA